MTLVIACGLKREARIVERAGRDVFAVVGGGLSHPLARDLDGQVAMFPGIVLSAGVAGALDPALKPGDVVIDGDAAVVALLKSILPDATVGTVHGADTIVATMDAKYRLAADTGAIAVDMESHVAASIARRRSLPFGVIRAISDTAAQTLPPAALVGMRPDGGMALGAVLLSLARHPSQLAALIATGRHASRAFRSLERAFDALYAADFDRIGLEDMRAR